MVGGGGKFLPGELMAESIFGYAVYASNFDPDDPSALEFIGGRKTLRGAQTLAETRIGRIYGFFSRPPTAGWLSCLRVETKRGVVEIRHGWYVNRKGKKS